MLYWIFTGIYIYAGLIPGCAGIIAFGQNLRTCEEILHSTLGNWVLVGLKQGNTLSIIEGIDLNKEIVREPVETV